MYLRVDRFCKYTFRMRTLTAILLLKYAIERPLNDKKRKTFSTFVLWRALFRVLENIYCVFRAVNTHRLK